MLGVPVPISAADALAQKQGGERLRCWAPDPRRDLCGGLSSYAATTSAIALARRTLTFTSTREPSRLIIAIRRSTLMRRKSALRTREKSAASEWCECSGAWQCEKSYRSGLIHFEDVIRDGVRRVSSILKVRERSLQQGPRPLAIDRRQNDQPGMNFRIADQAAKVARIFGDDYAILCDTPLKDPTVRLATAANVQRMNRVVTARFIEPGCQLRRQTLVDEQLHAASAHGRPPGRPMSGCARA
jgi:hypothetical protein